MEGILLDCTFLVHSSTSGRSTLPVSLAAEVERVKEILDVLGLCCIPRHCGPFYRWFPVILSSQRARPTIPSGIVPLSVSFFLFRLWRRVVGKFAVAFDDCDILLLIIGRAFRTTMRLSRPWSFAAGVASASAAVSISRSPLSQTSGRLPWSHLTVEWSPKIAKLCSSQPEIFQAATHWVFPDLPQVLTPKHRKSYLESIPPQKRIQTLAACRHEKWQSLVEAAKHRLEWVEADGVGNGKLLLVGGNDKTGNTLSTIEAANILRSELGVGAKLWGVADPNDPESVAKVQAKAEAGLTGFLTQPLLSSTAWDTLHAYSGWDKTLSIVVGMALPRTAKSLQFWRQLLDRPELLEDDPLFQSHLAYFSQPYTTSLAWAGRELQQYATSAAAGLSTDSGSSKVVDGIHLMPLQNTQDLAAIMKSLSRY